MREILTWFLPIYFLLFFGFAFLWRSWWTYRLTGVNPYRLMSNPGPEEVTSRDFRLLPSFHFRSWWFICCRKVSGSSQSGV